MNKNKDLQIYLRLDQRLRFQGNSLAKRKVAQSRILKLSVSGADAPYSTIGKFLHSSDEFQKSLALLKRATAINPQNTVAQICLADSFLKLGKENECFFTVQKALSVSPRESALHSLIIKILKGRNRLQDLSAFYQETADMIQDKNSVLELYIESAEILENLKIIPQALEQYQKASETNAMSIQQHFQYGDILSRQRRFEEALAQFEHILKLLPTNSNAINNIASLHYELGRVEKSFEVFEEIIKNGLEEIMTYPNYLLVLYHLDKDEQMIKMHEDTLQRYPQKYREQIEESYEIELRVAEEKLARNLDEKAREFYIKKIKGLKKALSLSNSPQG